MGRHECDCGAIYQNVNGVEACQLNNHGRPPRPCDWFETQESDHDPHYRTECGEEFAFISGTPGQNGMKFCPFCGAPLNEILFADQFDPPDDDPGPIEDRDCDYWNRVT